MPASKLLINIIQQYSMKYKKLKPLAQKRKKIICFKFRQFLFCFPNCSSNSLCDYHSNSVRIAVKRKLVYASVV